MRALPSILPRAERLLPFILPLVLRLTHELIAELDFATVDASYDCLFAGHVADTSQSASFLLS